MESPLITPGKTYKGVCPGLQLLFFAFFVTACAIKLSLGGVLMIPIEKMVHFCRGAWC